jgi:dTDP-4-dehydrorhamnose reductase
LRITSSTTVLVTGASGSLGWVVARALACRARVIGTYLAHPQVPRGVIGARLDLADGSSIESLFKSGKVDVVVHAAAVTDPDACERDAATALRVNFEATHRLASCASRAGSPLVFISTDLVFDGAKGHYSEDDGPRPLSIYGASKLQAEEAVLAAEERNLALRSALIYGFGSPAGKTFLGRLLEVLAAGGPARLFADQMRSPVLVDELAESVVLAIEQGMAGLYHLGGADAVSRYEFGREVCRVFGYSEGLLVPTRMAECESLARRPLDVTLDSSKFARATGRAPCGLAEGLERARRWGPGAVDGGEAA